MPKEVSFNIKGNSNIATLVKELQNLKDAAAAVNDISGGGTGGGAGASPRGMMPKMYGPGGKSTFSGYKPKGFDGRGTSAIDWMSTGGKKSSYEIDEMMPKKKGGGGGLRGGLVVGAAAGGAMALIKAVTNGAHESQILNKTLSTLSKIVGFMVDLVLLPFIPILVVALLGLVSIFSGFNTWWQSIWDTIKKEGLFGLLKLGLIWVYEQLPEWLQGLVSWFFSDKPIGQKIVDVVIAIATLAGGFFGFLGDKVMGAIFDFLFGAGSYDTAKKVVLDFALNFLGDPLGWLAYAVGFAFGFGVGIVANIISMTLEVINGTLKSFWDFVNWIWDVATGKIKIDPIKFLLDILPKNPADALWGILEWLMAGGQNIANSFVAGGNAGYAVATGVSIPATATAADGGYVAQTGFALIHKGETVTPAGQSAGMTFNIKCNDVQSIETVIRNTMRKEGARYMA